MGKITKNTSYNLSHGFFLTGFLLLSLIFFTVSLSSILFLFGISINLLTFAIACILAFISTYFVALKFLSSNQITIITAFIAGILIFSFSLFINSTTMETTWDGNWYHKTAIGMLKNGWNPTRESAVEFYDSVKNPIKTPRKKEQKFTYENHYTKGIWIFSANIYKLTNNIETSHSVNLLIMFMVFCLLAYLLLFKLSPLAAVLTSAITVFNPIVAPQLFVNYNDGLLGLFTIANIVSLILIVSQKDKKSFKLGFILFFMTTTLLINVKFTGLMFFFFYSAAFFVYILASPQLRSLVVKKFILIGFMATIFAIFIVGFSPYISNPKNGLHPLHPLAGSGKIDIMTKNSPKEFIQDKRPLAPFIKSIFGKMNNFSYDSPEKVELKIPFTFFESEFIHLKAVDPRISGNGIFFSGIFLLSLAIIIIYIAKNYRTKSTEFHILLCILIPSTLILLIFKEMWWARYFPHLSVILTLAMYILSRQKGEIFSTLFYGIFFIGLINNCLLLGPNLENGKKIAELSTCGDISQKNEIFYRLAGDNFYGTLFNILDCRQSNPTKFKLSKMSKKFYKNKFQNIYLVQGYLEVFYEK